MTPCAGERLALSVKETASALGISERTMRSILPGVPHFRIGGRVRGAKVIYYRDAWWVRTHVGGQKI